ncbi:MAG: hypothetical protein U0228_08370 [Myxococcaceae bacterium]
MKIDTKAVSAVEAKLNPKAAVKAAPKQSPKSVAQKFSKDEMSFGIGKALKLPPEVKKGSLADKVKTLLGNGVKDLGEIFARIHDLGVARGLKSALNGELEGVKLSRPLPPSEAPHRGKDGRMYAPNGDPLIEVKLSSKSFGTAETSSSRTAYVNPKTNEYYVVDKHGTIGAPVEKAYGPMALPKGSHFEDKSFSPWELRQLERAANGSFPNFPGLPTFPHPQFPRDPGFTPPIGIAPNTPRDPGFSPPIGIAPRTPRPLPREPGFEGHDFGNKDKKGRD